MISGARYQSETMVFDLRRCMNEAFLARPKSATFTLPIDDISYRELPSLVSRMLSGLISRWRIILPCIMSTAVRSCLTMV